LALHHWPASLSAAQRATALPTDWQMWATLFAPYVTCHSLSATSTMRQFTLPFLSAADFSSVAGEEGEDDDDAGEAGHASLDTASASRRVAVKRMAALGVSASSSREARAT